MSSAHQNIPIPIFSCFIHQMNPQVLNCSNCNPEYGLSHEKSTFPRRSCGMSSLVKKDQEDLVHGLNAIDDLNTPRSDERPCRGIMQRSSQMRTAKAQQGSGSFGRNWMAKKQELVLVNKDDGAIGEEKDKNPISYQYLNTLDTHTICTCTHM